MAGRIRTIKPELLEDEKTAELDHETWRFFVSLLLVADDHGNCRANPNYLQGQILHSAPVSRDTRETLATLSNLGLIVLYEVRGQQYLHISGWEKHQKVDRPSKPRVPTLEEAENSCEREHSKESTEVSRDTRETLATDPDHRPPTPTTDPERDRARDPARPGNLDDALKLPVRERAQAVLDEEHVAQWVQPHKWPEVVQLGEDFAVTMGWTAPRLTRANDSQTMALVRLLAAFSAEELALAVAAAPSDDWLTQGRKGLSSLTVEVVSRLLSPKRASGQRARRGGFVPQGNHGRTGTEKAERI